tara:strand:- start:10203 stop:11987 length:1785 start_codon:yes stop_codon:yes gene_type:complete
MKYILLFLLSGSFYWIQAQTPVEEIRMFISTNSQSASQKSSKSSDTLILPFIDGFNNGLRPEWSSLGVVQANNWSKDPLSSGAAVFDGVSFNGEAYRPGIINNDSITDVLISPYFNFQGATDIVLSFFIQNGGWGDPTETQDSLIIHFWNPSDSLWIHGGSLQGGGDQEKWHAAAFSFPSILNGQKGVRFKISRFASPGGMFDHFLIDYLEVGANRTLSDTLLFDPSWTRIPSSITRIFHEIPWWHYNSLILERDSLTVSYRRNGIPPVGGWQLNLGKYVWKDDNGNIIASRLSVPVVTNLVHNVSTPYQFSISKPGINMLGPSKWKFKGWFDGENVGELFNDTLKITQEFGSRYAQEDGSAERSYGVSQGTEPRLAQEFNFIMGDTIVGLDLSIASAGYDWSNMTFKIGIWEVDSIGLPGDQIYISDSSFAPVLPFGNSPFRHFILDTNGIYVPQNVFIGIIQTTGPAITIGLDLHTNGGKVYGDLNGWFPSLLPGRLLMRPLLRNLPNDLGYFAVWSEEMIKLFPNPTYEFFNLINAKKFEKFDIYSGLGEKIYQFSADQYGKATESSISFPNGIYFIKGQYGSNLRLLVRK